MLCCTEHALKEAPAVWLLVGGRYECPRLLGERRKVSGRLIIGCGKNANGVIGGSGKSARDPKGLRRAEAVVAIVSGELEFRLDLKCLPDTGRAEHIGR